MANDFDFKLLQDTKPAQYLKDTIKTLGKGKSNAAIVMIKFVRTGKPQKVAIIEPMLKVVDAKDACATVVKEKLHPKKFIACVELAYDSEKIDGYSNGAITLTPINSKGGLDGGKILKETEKFFKDDLQMKLTVVGFSEDSEENSEEEEEDAVSEASTDTDTDESSIKELRQSFNEAKQMYKQVGKVEANLKAKTMLATWNKVEDLMPQLQEFIASSDKKGQIETAEKISAAAKTIQDALKPSIDKIKAKQGEKSNTSLDSLTGGISGKAAQLLKDYQDEIASIDGLADKLKSISQIA